MEHISREQVYNWHIKDKPELPEKIPQVSEIWQAKIRTHRGTDLYLTLYLWHGMSEITKEGVQAWIERHTDVGVIAKLEKLSIPVTEEELGARLYEFYDDDFEFHVEIDADAETVQKLLDKYRKGNQEYCVDGWLEFLKEKGITAKYCDEPEPDTRFYF